MQFHIVHHLDDALAERLCRINERLGIMIENQEAIMATLDEVLKDVTDESTQLDGIATLITGLQQQVKDAMASAGISAADQAKIDAIFTGAEANKMKIANALAANTAPPPIGATPAP